MDKTPTTTPRGVYTGDIPHTPMRFIWHITKPHKMWSLIAMITMTAAQVLGIFSFYIISKLIDDFSTAPDTDAQLEILMYWGLVFFALIIFERLSWRVSGIAGIQWLVGIHTTGYQALYRYLVNHSHTYFTNRFAGSLSNKVSNAADGSTRLIERLLWGAVPEIISIFATLYLFFLIHWSVALVLLLTVIGVLVLNIWFVKKRRPHVVAFSQAASKVRGEGVDLMTNIAAARQYARRIAELDRLDMAIYDRAAKDKKQSFIGEWLMAINTVIGIALTGAVLLIVYQLLERGLSTAGELVLVLMLLGRIGFVFATLGNMLNGFVRMYGEAEEGLDDILIDYDIVDSPNAKELTVAEGGIVWDKVNFVFDTNKVFRDFDLTILPHQRIGLVGPSGAGKTTFVSLLLRQHDLESGSIEIDGQNIADVTQDSLREQVAVVPQEPMLFHRSIRENIAYGKPDATDEEIIEVAKKAQAHDFISALPLGYDTMVGERGIKLSGGQKQRVAIARAMIKDAPILVLDEATSALDSESEVAIQKALHELMEGKTVVAIAHRLSTLREMDRIIVLENGQIVEDGTHTELADAGGTYTRLWKHQAGGFLQE